VFSFLSAQVVRGGNLVRSDANLHTFSWFSDQPVGMAETTFKLINQFRAANYLCLDVFGIACGHKRYRVDFGKIFDRRGVLRVTISTGMIHQRFGLLEKNFSAVCKTVFTCPLF
jgi:hypothetical protein